MRLEAPAKINIGLLVGALRDDGYHDIETIMARISLYDIIDAEVRPSDALSVSITGNEGYIGDGMDLMEKAARLFSDRSGISFSLTIAIDKRIPARAGLGGGSSDAAAVLRFLDGAFSHPLSRHELMDLAAAVGSDVPFFMAGYPGALVRGRGEIVMSTYVPCGRRIALFVPEEGVSTAQAYRLLDRSARPERHLAGLAAAFPTPSSHPNDFAAAAGGSMPSCIPGSLIQDGAYISMTGSGSAWFAFFSDNREFVFDILENCDIVSAYII